MRLLYLYHKKRRSSASGHQNWTKRALAGHKEEGKKKDTPAPVWAGAYTRRVGSERRQTGWLKSPVKTQDTRREKAHQPLSGRARTRAGWEVRGGRLGESHLSDTS